MTNKKKTRSRSKAKPRSAGKKIRLKLGEVYTDSERVPEMIRLNRYEQALVDATWKRWIVAKPSGISAREALRRMLIMAHYGLRDRELRVLELIAKQWRMHTYLAAHVIERTVMERLKHGDVIERLRKIEQLRDPPAQYQATSDLMQEEFSKELLSGRYKDYPNDSDHMKAFSHLVDDLMMMVKEEREKKG